MAAIATTSSPTSLFDSPNENVINKNVTCLMARGSEVSSSIYSFPKITMNTNMNDEVSLRMKEVVALDCFLTNLQGEHKIHFDALMSQLSHSE